MYPHLETFSLGNHYKGGKLDINGTALVCDNLSTAKFSSSMVMTMGSSCCWLTPWKSASVKVMGGMRCL